MNEQEHTCKWKWQWGGFHTDCSRGLCWVLAHSTRTQAATTRLQHCLLLWHPTYGQLVVHARAVLSTQMPQMSQGRKEAKAGRYCWEVPWGISEAISVSWLADSLLVSSSQPDRREFTTICCQLAEEGANRYQAESAQVIGYRFIVQMN